MEQLGLGPGPQKCLWGPLGNKDQQVYWSETGLMSGVHTQEQGLLGGVARLDQKLVGLQVDQEQW